MLLGILVPGVKACGLGAHAHYFQPLLRRFRVQSSQEPMPTNWLAVQELEFTYNGDI